MSDLLTIDEHKVLDITAKLWNQICIAIPDGPTRDADLSELIAHLHAIQRYIMGNAAARAYPRWYRALGLTLTKEE